MSRFQEQHNADDISIDTPKDESNPYYQSSSSLNSSQDPSLNPHNDILIFDIKRSIMDKKLNNGEEDCS